jgi:arylsulfatase A-like enzyme
MDTPSIVYVFADQWRAQAFGYAGDPNVQTPHLDALSHESANFPNAIAGIPVCSPSRACLLTGQYPLTHGIFVNDVPLGNQAVGMGTAFKAAGYRTAYIGKWHVDGHGRSAAIPRERRQGFDYWKVLECTHDYNRSAYYDGDENEKRLWNGYDAFAQTADACRYLRDHAARKEKDPFLLVLSFGPPHDPYLTAPEDFRKRYDPAKLSLRSNVPADKAEEWRTKVAGYYAHCTALDTCVGDLLRTLDETGQAENTLFVFTSDHGDMLGSHGEANKQRPWDESVRVPFLLRWPRRFGKGGRTCDALLNTPDILPTLCGLAGVPIPRTVEGLDYSRYLSGGANPSDGAALIQCVHPFGQWNRPQHGGREYRGLRTARHTYVRDLNGPWLLYDNEKDPFQMTNLVSDPAAKTIRERLDEQLTRRLAAMRDEFLPGMEYIRRWKYNVDATGTVPYAP